MYRCAAVMALPDILDARRTQRIADIGTEIIGWCEDIELDSMIAAGIGLPEKPPTTELDLV